MAEPPGWPTTSSVVAPATHRLRGLDLRLAGAIRARWVTAGNGALGAVAPASVPLSVAEPGGRAITRGWRVNAAKPVTGSACIGLPRGGARGIPGVANPIGTFFGTRPRRRRCVKKPPARARPPGSDSTSAYRFGEPRHRAPVARRGQARSRPGPSQQAWASVRRARGPWAAHGPGYRPIRRQHPH